MDKRRGEERVSFDVDARVSEKFGEVLACG